MKKPVILYMLLLFGFGALSQKSDTVIILPGSKLLRTNRLHDYRASYYFFSYTNGEEKQIGGLDDQFKVSEGRKQGLRICSITFGTNHIVDSGLCVLRSLSPIYHRSIQTKKNMNLIFDEKKVEGRVMMKGKDNSFENVHQLTATPLFDSYYEDILAKTIAVKPGVVFRFPEYIYEKGGLVWSVGEIVRGDSASERRVKFYELDAKNKITRTTTYIINESTNEILQREYVIGANSIVMKKK